MTSATAAVNRVMIGTWDIILIIAVSVMGTALAYVRAARWKALFISLPIPFTISTLALGQPIAASNASGLIVLFFYTQAVRLLFIHVKLPIVLAIVLSALGYIGVGAALSPIIPKSDWAFYITVALAFTMGVLCYRLLPHRVEPSQRSLLPIWVKLPIIMGVVLGLVLIKKYLGGFITMFPMVGVVAAYEARRSLWTLGRQIPVLMLTTTPMMVASRLSQPYVGLAWSLAVGWVVFLAIFIPFTILSWRKQDRQAANQAMIEAQPATTVLY
ncbi:MAG: hypothetical protein ACYCZF_13260 [Anaerolineae bacterium]